MANVWGYQERPEFYVKCDRCGEYDCICGDPAFEAWIAEELAAQAAETAE